MLIGASLLIMSVFVIFSLILGGGFTSGVTEIAVDNVGIVNGTSTTFVIPPTSIFFGIDTGSLVGALLILTATLVGVAAITGITVAATGLNAQSSRIMVLASIYGTLWYLLSIPAYPLIISISVVGYLIYIFITIAYVIGAIQKITSGGS